ncbi:hypothetical protein LCGC14_1187480, partial [marine sediment metagenome]
TGTKAGTEAARTMLERLRLRHPSIGFAAGDGLVAVLCGPQRNDRLVKLAELEFGTPGHAEVHHVFRRLGAANRHEAAARAERDRAETALEQARSAERGSQDLRDRQARLDDALKSLGDAYDRSGQQVAGLESELAELRRAARTREADLAGMAAQLEAAARDKAAALEARDRVLMQAEERLGTARQSLAEANRTRTEAEAQSARLRQDRDTQLQALQTATEAAAQDSARADALQSERDSLARDLAAATARAERAATALARAEHALTAADRQAAETASAGQDEIAALRTALDAARADAETSQQADRRAQDHAEDLRVLTARIEALREEGFRSAEALREAQARQRVTAQEAEAERAHAAQLRRERDEARQLVEDFLASTSWKLTAPARRVALAMRRRGPGSDPQT